MIDTVGPSYPQNLLHFFLDFEYLGTSSEVFVDFVIILSSGIKISARILFHVIWCYFYVHAVCSVHGLCRIQWMMIYPLTDGDI